MYIDLAYVYNKVFQFKFCKCYDGVVFYKMCSNYQRYNKAQACFLMKYQVENYILAKQVTNCIVS